MKQARAKLERGAYERELEKLQVELPKRDPSGSYDDVETLGSRRSIPEPF
jgi:hypothetical protein